jgi:hypothetical protein
VAKTSAENITTEKAARRRITIPLQHNSSAEHRKQLPNPEGESAYNSNSLSKKCRSFAAIGLGSSSRTFDFYKVFPASFGRVPDELLFLNPSHPPFFRHTLREAATFEAKAGGQPASAVCLSGLMDG